MEGLEKARELALNEYIKQMRTQEECIGFIDGFNKAIEYANQQNNQWVSVEEMLPTKEEAENPIFTSIYNGEV